MGLTVKSVVMIELFFDMVSQFSVILRHFVVPRNEKEEAIQKRPVSKDVLFIVTLDER